MTKAMRESGGGAAEHVVALDALAVIAGPGVNV
jgi:hypothetical protein